jgi:transposase
MSFNFHSCHREQNLLLPPDISEWLPEDHVVWFIFDSVEAMDLSKFYQSYRADGLGNTAYEPSMMVELYIYAYSKGIRSSRRIEALCEDDVGARVITGNQKPDHATLARFRQKHEKALKGLLSESLGLCFRSGMGKVGIMALDGTKMKANASGQANRTYEQLKQQVSEWFDELDEQDRREDEKYGKHKRGDVIPEDLRDADTRRQWIRERLKEMQKANEAQAKEKQKAIEKRKREEQQTGKKKRGRKPHPPDPDPPDSAKINVTDPDSGIMKTANGFIQGYNAQAMVSEDQLFLGMDVTREKNDRNQLHPMLEEARQTIKHAEISTRLTAVAADAGYWSEKNVNELSEEDPECYIAVQKGSKQRRALADKDPPRGRIPKDATPKYLMERKLRTKKGKGIYGKRGQMVEAVFGQMKENLGFRGFQRRGINAVTSEWSFMGAVMNLMKLRRNKMAFTGG